MKKTLKNTNKKKTKARVPPEVELLLDKETVEELQAFAENDKIKRFPSESELTKHGGELSSLNFLPQLGLYNPDTISVDTYNRMKSNPQIYAGLNLIKLPIITQNWGAECEEDQDIADYVTQALKPLWYNLISTSLTAVEYGFSAHEIVYRNKMWKGLIKTFPKKFKSLYPEWIKLKLDDHENFDGLIQTWHGTDIILKRDKAFVFTQNKGDSFGNLFGTSRLKSCYDPWYWWVALVQFMLRYFEKKGTPPVVVRFPIGKTRDGTDHIDIAVELGKSLLNDSVVALSSKPWEGTEKQWDINYLMDDKRGEMFINALNWLDAKMLRGMFIPERVFTQDTSTRSGSYALSRVHADMFLFGEEALIVELENQINKYIIPRFVKPNFGENAPDCYVRIERITDDQKAFLREIFMEMVKTGTAIPAVMEVAKNVGVPMNEHGEAPTVKKPNGDIKETKKNDISKKSGQNG